MSTGKTPSIDPPQTSARIRTPASSQRQEDPSGATPDNASAHQLAGNLAVQSLLRPDRIQSVSGLSKPSDHSEREAERIADQVMATTDSWPFVKADTIPERSQSLGRTEVAALHSSSPSFLRTGGAPLSPSLRAFFEPRFGRDFSQIRLHTDERAAATAQAVQARAFAIGQDVVLAAGVPSPNSREGRRLLAHELAHIAQQDGADSRSKIQRQPSEGGQTSGTAPASVAPPAPSEPTSSVPTAESLANKKLVEAALASRSPGDVKKIKNFAEVSEPHKFALISILLDQSWVGPLDEYALENIWRSFGERLVVAASSVVGSGLWTSSIEAGAELEKLPAIVSLRDHFRPDVIALASGYLDQNDTLVLTTSRSAGIPLTDATPADAPTAVQQDLLLKMKAAAESVAHVQEQLELSRNVYVGYSLGHVLLEARQYWIPVTFDPHRPPERADAPVVDLNDPSPMAERHPVLNPHPPITLQPYGALLNAHQLGVASIQALTSKYPLIYGITREGKSATTGAFALAAPALARHQLSKALIKLRSDIDQAKKKLGNALDPLDLAVLHAQLFSGIESKSKVNWSVALPRRLAEALRQGHDEKRALVALGLETVSQMAFMLGSVMPGVGGIAASLVGLATTGIKAGMSAERYEAMLQASKTAVAPGTDIVSAGQVDDAKAQRDADQAALLLAIITTGAAVASAGASWGGQKLAAARHSAGKAPNAKTLAKVPGSQKPTSFAGGDTIVIASGTGGGAEPAYTWKIFPPDSATGDCLGFVSDTATGATGIFRINLNTGDGQAYFGGKTRVIAGGKLQPERPALAATPSPTPETTPASASSPTGPAAPGLAPAGGFDNAFPATEPVGVAAETSIGKFYPGMRQLPAGFPAYDHVRGGITTVKFTSETFPVRGKKTVLNLSIEGGEWLSDKTVPDAKNATPEHIKSVVTSALDDMETKSGRRAEYDPNHDWYVRVEKAAPEKALLHITVPGAERALVGSLQSAAEEALAKAVANGDGPGVPVTVRVTSWR
jgi:hypothetical protein